MKFTEHLSAHLTPEWRKQYIKYMTLKEFLYNSLEKFAEIPVNDIEKICEYFDECDKEFFTSCQLELEKVNNFYAEKLAEAKRKLAALKDELRIFFTSQNSRRNAYYFNSSNITRRIIKDKPLKKNGMPSIVRETDEKIPVAEDKQRDIDKLLSRRVTIRQKIADRIKVENPTTEKIAAPVFKLHDLKLAFSEFYLSLVLLQNYQSLNFTGFRKILKKHDKLFQKTNGLEWHKNVVSKELFYKDNTVDSFISEVEDIYTDSLESGNRQKAMKRLRVPPLPDYYSSWSVFRFGFSAGIFIMQVAVIIFSKLFITPREISWPTFRLLRSILLIDIFICFIGLNIYGWRVSGVNHVLIFEIDPRLHLDHFQVLEMGFFFLDLWGAAVIFLIYSDCIHVPYSIPPLILIVFMIVFLLQPFRFCHKKTRKWFLRRFVLVLKAPFVPVKFAEFFLADQLSSLNFVFPDIAYFMCYYSTWIDWTTMRVKSALVNLTVSPPGQNTLFSPNITCDNPPYGIFTILASIPAWWRFVQCLRRYRDLDDLQHLYNAAKYSTTLIAAFFCILSQLNQSYLAFTSMLLSLTVNATCLFLWDVIMDYGLFDFSCKENFGLKDQLVYRFRSFYYFAIVSDFIIRFAWAINLLFTTIDVIDIEIVRSCVLLAEVLRRIMWNLLRLENEHLNNCGNFRAVRDIFVAPIRKSIFDARPSNGTDSTLFKHLMTPRDSPDSDKEFD